VVDECATSYYRDSLDRGKPSFFQELDLHPGFAKFGPQSPVLPRLLSARLRAHGFGVVSSLFLDPAPHRLGDQVVGLRNLRDSTVLHRPPRGPLSPRSLLPIKNLCAVIRRFYPASRIQLLPPLFEKRQASYGPYFTRIEAASTPPRLSLNASKSRGHCLRRQAQGLLGQCLGGVRGAPH